MRCQRQCTCVFLPRVTSFTDPGTLPRGLDPEPLRAEPEPSVFDAAPPLGEPQDMIVPLWRVDDGGDPSQGPIMDFPRRWCTTCRLYRPPRCSHCRSCDHCVENLDHHCVFLNACIGRRNYVTFYAMLGHMLAVCCLGITGAILHLYYLAKPKDAPSQGMSVAVKTSPASVAFFWLALIWAVPLGSLFGYHTWLLLRNRTTVEQLRYETTHELYDMHQSQRMWSDESACIQQIATAAAAVQTQCTPADFATQPPARPHTHASHRARTPFEYASQRRNARAVLGRPTPAACT